MFSVGDIKKHRGHWTPPHGKMSGHVGLHQRREWWFNPGGFAQMKWSLEESESKLWAVSERSLTLRKVASPSFIFGIKGSHISIFQKLPTCTIVSVPLNYLPCYRWSCTESYNTPFEKRISTNLAFFFSFSLNIMPHFVNVQSALRCHDCIHFFAWSFPSSPCFRSSLESSNSGVKCLIQDTTQFKRLFVKTQYKMKPSILFPCCSPRGFRLWTPLPLRSLQKLILRISSPLHRLSGRCM